MADQQAAFFPAWMTGTEGLYGCGCLHACTSPHSTSPHLMRLPAHACLPLAQGATHAATISPYEDECVVWEHPLQIHMQTKSLQVNAGPSAGPTTHPGASPLPPWPVMAGVQPCYQDATTDKCSCGRGDTHLPAPMHPT